MTEILNSTKIIQLELDLRPLRARIDGDVVGPGDADWDEARQAWNLAVDQRPAAVAIPEAAEDVAAVVEFARTAACVAPQGTGHNAGPYARSPTRSSSRPTSCAASRSTPRRASPAPGRRAWAEVAEPAAEHGLAPLAGSSPDVGVVGYVLGGGLWWLARKHGLASNSVRAIELVTADGALVRADRDDHPDLFWALRGGGGNFGIVTAVEIELYPVPDGLRRDDAVAVGARRRGPQGLGRVDPHRARRGQHERAPDPGPAAAGHPRVPPRPRLRGDRRRLPRRRGGRRGAVRPAARARPEMDSFGPMAPGGLSFIHMDPEGPTPGIGGHTMLGELDDEAIDALVAVAGARLRHAAGDGRAAPAGGAVARSGEGRSTHARARTRLFAVGIPMTPEVGAAVHAHLAEADRRDGEVGRRHGVHELRRDQS